MRRYFVVCLTLCFFQTQAFAQESKTSSIILGLQSPILNNGFGFDLGLRTELAKKNSMALSGQLSINQNFITGAFLTGETGAGNMVNLLLGPKLGFLNKSKLAPQLLLLGGIQSQYWYGFSQVQANGLDVYPALMTEVNFRLSPKFGMGIYGYTPGWIGARFTMNI